MLIKILIDAFVTKRSHNSQGKLKLYTNLQEHLGFEQSVNLSPTKNEILP